MGPLYLFVSFTDSLKWFIYMVCVMISLCLALRVVALLVQVFITVNIMNL